MSANAAVVDAWPSLPLQEWRETYATLHLWTQIVGKVHLVQTPWANHSWHVTLYSYVYPEPAGFSQWAVRPAQAFYSPDLREDCLLLRARPKIFDEAGGYSGALIRSLRMAQSRRWRRRSLDTASALLAFPST